MQCCWREFLVIQVMGQGDSMACQDLKSSLFQLPAQGGSSEVQSHGSGFYWVCLENLQGCILQTFYNASSKTTNTNSVSLPVLLINLLDTELAIITI